MAATTPSDAPAPDFLIRGNEYLAKHPEFKLIGRKDELNAAFDVLLRKSTGNNLVLHGPEGVGLSSIVMGLQAAKNEPGTPFDIVGKSFFYLDVDALFSTSDSNAIKDGFQNAITTLSKCQDAVLVIEDTKGFLDGMSNSGTSNLMNILMRAVKNNPNLQTVFEAADGDLPALLKSHSDISNLFTLQDINEPPKEDLRAIVDHAAENLQEKYGVTISKGAIDSVMELTAKYPGLTLDPPTAQPKRSVIILEGAMTAYCRTAHATPPELANLEATLENIKEALDKGIPAEGDLADKTPDELSAIRVETENSIKEMRESWDARQKQIRDLYAEQSKAQDKIQEINAAIDAQKKADADFKAARKEYSEKFNTAASDAEKAAIKKDFKDNFGSELVVSAGGQKDNFSEKYSTVLSAGTGASDKVQQLLDKRKPYAEAFEKNKAQYEALTQDINKGLALADDQVLNEFSRLSGLPVNKLKQDEGEKLLRLADTIKQRVYGQDEPAEALADAVQRGRTGLKKPNKPIGSFLFLGPSGVGKTEMAKALAEALFGDESALQVYNMSEFMEKHASAVLIGAPPGYEGYEEGGILTNNMRRQPYCVNVFDEAEKANKQVFDLFLQIIDEGVLTDRRGMKASFANSINIMTSNVGAKYFLDENLSFEDASKMALRELWNKDPKTGAPLDEDLGDDGQPKGFRPEFLNRFTGIFCFHRLENGQIKLIAAKSLKELNSWLEEKGIDVEMPEKDLNEMCEQQYDPTNGGRGIMNYIEKTVTSDAAKTLLKNPNQPGTVTVSYTPAPEGEDKSEAKIATSFKPKSTTQEPAAKTAAPAAANSNTKAAAKPAAA